MSDDDITKIYLQRFDEAQRTRNSSLALYAALALSAAVLMFSAHVAKDEIKVPLLDISMDRADGIEIILLVSCVLLFRYFSLDSHTWLIRNKLNLGVKDENAYLLTVPATLSPFALLGHIPNEGLYSAVITSILWAIPLGLAIFSGARQIVSNSDHHVPQSFIITLLADLILAGLSVLVILRSRREN